MTTRYRITIGDEIIEFEGPDDLSDAEIEGLGNNFLADARPGQTFDTQYAGEVVEQPQGIVAENLADAAGVIQGIAKPLDAAANILEEGYNQTAGRLFGESTSADTPAFQDAAAKLGPGDPNAQTVGEIAGTTFLTRGMGGPGTQGAAGGLLLSEGDNPWEIARDMFLGWAGGKIADPIIKGVGNVISPVVDDAARLLRDAGAKLTPGQAIPALKSLEDKMMSWPFVGGDIVKGRQASFDSFNRAVMDDILKPIGEALPATIKTGQRAVKWVGDKLSSRYEALIPKLTLKPDAQLSREVADIGARLGTGELAPSTIRRFEAIVRDGLMGRMSGSAATGPQYQAADKYLGDKIARYARSTAPEDHALAEALRDLQSSLSGALARSNPKYAAELADVNRGWSLLVPAESAASQAKGGVFSADQFRRAVRANSQTVRKRGMARGEARGQELAEAGSEVLPSGYPDSGTAGREAFSFAHPQFWQGLAMRQVYGPGTQNALTQVALFPRPALAQPIGEFVKRLPAPQAGAAITLNALAPYMVPPADDQIPY